MFFKIITTYFQFAIVKPEVGQDGFFPEAWGALQRSTELPDPSGPGGGRGGGSGKPFFS